jgi:hypothetical protein
MPRVPEKKEVRDAALTSFFIAIYRFDFPAATSCREIAWRFILWGYLPGTGVLAGARGMPAGSPAGSSRIFCGVG